MKGSLALLLTITALLAGCLVPPEDVGGSRPTRHEFDEFTGVTTDSISTTPIGGLSSEMKSPARFSFTLSRHRDKGRNETFGLTVNYNGLGKWLFISPGESLVFLIDDQRVPLTTREGSQRFREVDGGNVRETANYSLSREIAKQIAEGKIVKVRLSGTGYFVDKTLNASNLRTFGEFVAKVDSGSPFTAKK